MNDNIKYKAISLFSGAGGDTLGMKMADIDVVGFIEIDKDAIKTHKLNFPNCKLIGTDITKIPITTFDNYVNKIDIIFGGFPCQSFSHGGKKNPLDTRGFLYQEFVKITNILKPSIIIGENVKGLLTRKDNNGRLFIDNIIRDFTNIGYNMKTILCNMKDYNIPQDRKRVIIYGVKSNLNLSINLNNVICNDRKYNKDILKYSLEDSLLISSKVIIDMIPENKFIIGEDSQIIGNPPTNLTKCYNNNHFSFGKRSKSVFSCIIDINDVSRTILSTYGRMPRLFVPVKNETFKFLRPYTIKELQLLQGFPEDFVFCGNKTSQIKQIGNAIPPIFVCYIMEYITGILSENIVEI